MAFDIDMIKEFYKRLPSAVNSVRKIKGNPLI